MKEIKCKKLSLDQQQHPSQWRRALFSAAMALSHCALADQTRQIRIRATAYYHPAKYYERGGLAKPENIDFTKISRVNYASFQLDESGGIWGTVSRQIECMTVLPKDHPISPVLLSLFFK
jgi:uncharacterized membrane protein (DUF2068 family)